MDEVLASEPDNIDAIWGKAEIFSYIGMPIPEFSSMFTPLEELPASAREVYEYNPEKAKQLLAEAGYPNGFKAEVLTTQPYVDLGSIVKEYWAKIGVDLNLDVREPAVAMSIAMGHKHKQMYLERMNPSAPQKFYTLAKGLVHNKSMVDDPRIDQVYQAVSSDVEHYFNFDKSGKLFKDITPYIIEQCYMLQLPAPYAYICWQPWVKGYHGEQNVGFVQSSGFPIYLWLDQDLKEKMTGKR